MPTTAYDHLKIDKIIDFGEAFSDIKQPNNVITSLDLFADENLSINKVLLDRLVEDADRVNKENAGYVQSDFNTTALPGFDTHFVELRAFKRLDKITSRSFEQARGFNKSVADSMDEAMAKYLNAHNIAYQNTLENILAEAVLAGKQTGVYVGDLDFYTEFGATKSTATFDFSSTANVLAQLDGVQRQIRQAARSKLKSMQGIVCLCTGEFAQNLAYHKSILDAVIYATPVNDPANFVGTVQFLLQAYPVWSLKGITFVDVTGDSYLESLIGTDNAVFIPRFDKSSGGGVYTCYNGIGTMHASLGKAPAKVRQYAVLDEMQFPTVISESAHLAVNNLPGAIVFASSI